MELLFNFGYLGIFLIIGMESIGIPVPGETTLITASVIAGTTHKLSIYLVLLAAILGAIIGDNIGYWIGRKLGDNLVVRYGKKVGLTEKKIRVGQYLFIKHGGKIVFFGRFFALLRILAAFLAGINKMSWKRFLFFNAAGAVIWASLYSAAAYNLGKNIHKLDSPLKFITFVITIFAVGGITILIKKYEGKLELAAEEYFKKV